MQIFKTKKEAQKAFDEAGIDYPKYDSGVNEGKIKGTLNTLSKIYSDAIADSEQEVEKDTPEVPSEVLDKPQEEETAEDTEDSEEDSEEKVTEKAEVTKQKPKFKRNKTVKRFNPMLFRKF